MNNTITQYYEVINNSTAAVAPGAAVSFSQDGNQFLGGNPGPVPSRVNDTTFLLGLGLWRVSWQVPVANSGQLGIGYVVIGPPSSSNVTSGVTFISETVVGTSWGHCQIVGDFLINVNDDRPGTTWQIALYNPMENNSSLNLLSAGSGNIDVVVTFTIEGLAV